VVVAAACGVFAIGLAVTASAGPKPVVVSVTMRDYSFVLSRNRVPVGTVRFSFVNRGATAHDFAIAGRRSRLLQPGARSTMTVVFKRAGRIPYRCTVAGHASLGMKGVLVVGSPPAPTGPTTTAPATTTTTAGVPALTLTHIGSFERPVLVDSPPGDPSRVFVVSQEGVIHEIDDGVLQPQPLLDIRDRVKEQSESGLLGLAFAPDFATSGHFYVDYNQYKGNDDLAIVEYTDRGARPVDEYSGRVVLEIVKPYENHNGGMLQFGPDGYLYIAVGNGDSGVVNKPGAFSQTLNDLLGDILRIDPSQSGDAPYTVPADNPFVNTPGARPEIWAYGLRNPWRFGIDPMTGNMLIGDVGEGTMEELDLVPAGSGGGQNFGFPCLEGTVPFDPTATCVDPVPPVAEWLHSSTVCSVIAGRYVHDPRLPALDGRFLVSDLCGGEILAGTPGGSSMSFADLGLHVAQPTSFGVDGQGRLYVCSLLGDVYRIDPA
jgi:glucose/arabinose dehydrogenase